MLEEMMMNKLIVLVLALAIAAPALADDRVPAPFRGEPGTTYSEWTYDDPCNVYNSGSPDYIPDWPESSSFVSGEGYTDPGPYLDGPHFSGQNWGNDGDPCLPDWANNLPGGRQGGINFLMGSWELNNFGEELTHNKDIWLQVTYWDDGAEAPAEFGFMSGCDVYQIVFIPGDPCAVPMASTNSGDTLLTEWDNETWGEPMYTWVNEYDGLEYGFSYVTEPLSEWDSETWGDPMETWDDSQDREEEQRVEVWGERVSEQILPDDWRHDVWAITLPVNPAWEFIEGWMGEDPANAVLIDQVVIETFCYVPEPATMVLLGLGSLLMIRRKR